MGDEVATATPTTGGEETTTKHRKFLFTRLAYNITPLNLIGFYATTFATICAYTFVNAAQPYVLNAIGIPSEEQGKATGDLSFYSELVIIALVSPWGILSDKIGRKPVYVAGLTIMALAFVLYPFAPSYDALIGFRLIFAVGAASAAGMLTSVLADTVYEPDKGRASGFMGLFSGLGAVFAAILLLKIPSWVAGGENELETDQGFKIMYGVTAAFMFLMAIFAAFALLGRTRAQAQNRHVWPHTLLKEGFAAAYNDRRLALAYGAGFVARGDAVVLTTFLSLWIHDHVINNGGSDEDAASEAGVITGVAQTCALVFSLFAGWLSTRLDNVSSLLINATIALIGYTVMSFVTDPTSTPSMVIACIVGMGEIGVIVASQSLASRRAPYRVRGSVGGAFGLCGSVGILVCSKLGGYLYDSWRKSAPFVVFACFNGLVVISCAAMLVYERTHGGPPPMPDNGEDEEEEKGVADGSEDKLVNERR